MDASHKLLGGALVSVASLVLAASASAAPSFVPALGSPITTQGQQIAQVGTGDFNGDGNVDLAAVAEGGTDNVTVMLGNGLGGFGFGPSSPFPVGTDPQAIAVGDFNGDGRPDFATADAGGGAGGTVSVYLGQPGGGFVAAPGSPISVGGPTVEPDSIVAGDFNGDGKLDLVFADSGSQNVDELLGNGAGGFGSPIAIATGLPNTSSPHGLAVGDLNGDGKLDLVVGDETAEIAVLLGNGGGGFSPATGSPFSTGAGSSPQAVAIGDFNGDGRPDVVAVEPNNDVIALLLNNGAGGLGAPQTFPSGGMGPLGLAVGDLNADGKLDVVVANKDSNTVGVLTGDGHGGLGATAAFSTDNGLSNTKPNDVTIADVNGDGQPDLITADCGLQGCSNSGDSSISILLNAEAGGITLTPASLPFGTRPLHSASAPTTVTATDTGTGVLRLAAAVTGANAGDFSIASNGCAGQTLLSGASCSLTVVFNASASGPRQAQLSFATNAPGAQPVLALTGTGASTPPSVTSARESNTKWRRGSKLAKISKKPKRPPPIGTIFSFALNEPAKVSFAFTQKVGGRKVKGKCVAQTKKNRRKPSCRRTVTQGTLRFAGHAGTNKVSFQGRISASRKLAPGSYTLVITAVNAAGQSSAPRSLSFTIVK